jgi:hypothetical protein
MLYGFAVGRAVHGRHQHVLRQAGYSRRDTHGQGSITASRYNRRIAEEFPHDLKSGEDAPEAAALYRKVLAAQPDKSVTIYADRTMGFLWTLAPIAFREEGVRT